MRQLRVRFSVGISPKLLGWVKGYCSAHDVKITHFVHEALEIRLKDLTGDEQHPSFVGSLPGGRPKKAQDRKLDIPIEDLNQCMQDWMGDENEP